MGIMNSKSEALDILKRSLTYLKPYWPLQLACFGVAAVLAVLSLVQPWINKLLIDDVLIAGDINGLKLICLLILLAYLLRSGFNVLLSYLYARVGGLAVYDLRKSLYNHIQSLSLPFFHSKRTGELIASFTSDISRMRNLYTSTIVNLLTDTLRFGALLVAMLLIDTRLTLIAALSLPFYGYFMARIGRPIRKASKAVQERRAAATGELQEKISGIREIKAFVGETIHSNKISKSFRDLFRAGVRHSVVGALGSATGLISAIAFVLVFWFGGRQVIAEEMKMGVFIAFIGYMGRLFGPVHTFITLNTKLQSTVSAAKRVFAVLDETPQVRLAPDAHEISRIEGPIVFDNVSFAYIGNSESTLDRINLEIAQGEMVAIAGASGSGKTTLAMLLQRFYDPTSGRILVNGLDLKQIDLASYRKRIGVVFQDAFLFDTSVRNNISFGRPEAREEEIYRAAEAACAIEFIEDLPKGMATKIGERGVSLSGGQQQRIAIARAILSDPDLVILDEATSALDKKSETYVQMALHRLFHDRTSLVIAHRLSTIADSNKIVFMQDGAIIEMGSYEHLMAVKGHFHRLYVATSKMS